MKRNCPFSNAEAKMYLTFVLSALGYDDTAGDFDYNNCFTLAEEVGLLSVGIGDSVEITAGGQTFTRSQSIGVRVIPLTVK